MNEKQINEIMENITEDSSLCIIREALRDYEDIKLYPPRLIDSFTKLDDGSFFAEYDGFLFEAKSVKAIINQILRHIWGEYKLK